MTSLTLGDGVASFQLRRDNVDIRTRLNTLSQELSSGKKDDLTAALGDTTLLRDIDRQLALAQTRVQNTKQTDQFLTLMQANLDRMDSTRSGLVEQTITVTPQSTAGQMQNASDAARSSFEAMVTALNARSAGQSLFSGNATDSQALAPAADILAALRTAIAGSPDATSLIAAVDTWFDAPGGSFDTAGYISPDTGPLTRRIGDGTDLQITAKADDPALRDMLKSTALAALANDPGAPLTMRDRADVMQQATTGLLSNAAPLTDLRASVGQAQAQVDTITTQATSEVSALSILRTNMDSADPFETATALQEVQTQLETHYTVTARLARLSLAEYLR